MIQILKKLKEKQKIAPIRIVFVCTANCCRSPLAEILFEKMLIAELGSAEKLAASKILIESAATSFSGYPISEKSANDLIETEGINAARCYTHKGRHLTEIAEPDLLLTMGNTHKESIEKEYPHWKHLVYTLEYFVKYDNKLSVYDIIDPINGTDAEFKRVKQQIKENLVLLLNEFKQAGLLHRD